MRKARAFVALFAGALAFGCAATHAPDAVDACPTCAVQGDASSEDGRRATSDAGDASSADAAAFACADAPGAVTAASLEEYVAKLPHGLEFDPLTPAQVDAAAHAATAVADGDADADARASAGGYAIATLRTHTECFTLLTPAPNAPRGQATLVLRAGWKRDLLLEAPHIPFDGNTDAEAALLFDALGARALLLAGAQRCASTTASGCHVNTECPAKISLISDPSHSVDTAFHGMHVGLAVPPRATLAVQLHTNLVPADNGDILVSNGTRGTSARVQALYAALTAAGSSVDARNCGDPKVPSTALCGTMNTQALASNGASNACTGAAGTARDQFLHIEQHSRRLDDVHAWSLLVGNALAEALPAANGDL